MSSIWKFPIETSGPVEMPMGAELLTVQEQNNTLCVWARIEQNAPKVHRHLAVYETGEYLPQNPGRYVATIQTVILEKPYVVHVYDLGETLIEGADHGRNED